MSWQVVFPNGGKLPPHTDRRETELAAAYLGGRCEPEPDPAQRRTPPPPAANVHDPNRRTP